MSLLVSSQIGSVVKNVLFCSIARGMIFFIILSLHMTQAARGLEVIIDNEMYGIADGNLVGDFKFSYAPDKDKTDEKITISNDSIKKYREQYYNLISGVDGMSSGIEMFLGFDELKDFWDAANSDGVQSSFMDMLFKDVTIPNNQCHQDGGVWQNYDLNLESSYLLMYSDLQMQNGYFRIRSHKSFVCQYANGETTKYSLKRKWVIAVLDHLKKKPSSRPGYETAVFASSGTDIELLGYYESIERFDPNWTTPDLVTESMRPHYYAKSPDGCLDIDFRDEPVNGIVIGPSTPGVALFCASGCRPGDPDATK